MASGRLGAADLAADTDTGIYTVPASTVATVNVTFCNRDPSGARLVRLAQVDGAVGDIANEDYLVFDKSVASKDFLKVTGIVMAAAETLVARSNNPSISVVVHGMEDTA